MKKKLKKEIAKIEKKLSNLEKEIQLRKKHIQHINSSIKREIDRMNTLKKERGQINQTLAKLKREFKEDENKPSTYQRWLEKNAELEKLELAQQTQVLKPAKEREIVKKIRDLYDERSLIEKESDFEESKKAFLRVEAISRQIAELTKESRERHEKVHECYLRVKELNNQIKKVKIELRVQTELLERLKGVLGAKKRDLDTISTIEEIVSKFEEVDISVKDLLEKKTKINMEDFYEIQRKINK